ncbi:MAG: hypothetical protein HKP30_00045 [Myxococcales bacterium]|nr:hypothetical protein [Myxococcales bacterium]
MSFGRLWILGIAVFVAGAAGAETPAWLEPRSDYRADTLMSSPDGEMRGQVWASGRKERREFTLQGRRHVMILRKDRGVTWVLIPDQKMYLENAIDPEMMPENGGRLEREVLGQETVNGTPATKYRVHGTTGQGDPFEGTMWMTKHEIPVRVVSSNGGMTVRMELSNLDVGPVDAARFEIPADFTRFELPPPAKADLDAYRRQQGGQR